MGWPRFGLETLDVFVDTEGPCWLWRRKPRRDGYGGVKVAGRQMYAHRAVRELLVGNVPDGLELDHLCRNQICVNPDHLEPVTHAENMRRSIYNVGPAHASPKHNGNRTHCIHGHLFDEANTYRVGGRRFCRVCNRLAVKRYKRGKALV